MWPSNWSDHVSGRTLFLVAGDVSAIGVITVTLISILPPIAAVLAIIWYIVQIYESRTIQNKLRSIKLRRLVNLRAKAVALELSISSRNFDLQGLDRANRVHLAATTVAAEQTHQQFEKDEEIIDKATADEKFAKAIKEAIKPIPKPEA